MECVRFLGMYHKKITFSQMKEGDIVMNMFFFYQNAEFLRGKKICFNLKTKIYISGSYPSKNVKIVLFPLSPSPCRDKGSVLSRSLEAH